MIKHAFAKRLIPLVVMIAFSSLLFSFQSAKASGFNYASNGSFETGDLTGWIPSSYKYVQVMQHGNSSTPTPTDGIYMSVLILESTPPYYHRISQWLTWPISVAYTTALNFSVYYGGGSGLYDVYFCPFFSDGNGSQVLCEFTGQAWKTFDMSAWLKSNYPSKMLMGFYIQSYTMGPVYLDDVILQGTVGWNDVFDATPIEISPAFTINYISYTTTKTLYFEQGVNNTNILIHLVTLTSGNWTFNSIIFNYTLGWFSTPNSTYTFNMTGDMADNINISFNYTYTPTTTPIGINVLDIPTHLALLMGISVLTAGLLCGLVLELFIVLPVIILTDNTLVITIFAIIGLCLGVALGWMPYVTLILIILIIALLFANKIRGFITGSGEGEK